jgi:Rieske Fe-S protein
MEQDKLKKLNNNITENIQNNCSRRDFLKTSAKTLIIGGIAVTGFNFDKLFANVEEAETTGMAKVINVSDYPELANTGGYAMITDKVIVFRTGGSSFRALNTTCTHKKCATAFNGSEFQCECHGSRFDKSGKVLEGPATKNLKSYKTTFDSAANTLTINM